MLEFVDVTKRFGGVSALADVSFTARPGEVTALVGPNGAGKTTLLTVTGGQMQPTSGQILLDGLQLSGRAPHQVARRGVARTFQHSRLVPSLTVRENVVIGALHARPTAGVSLRRPLRSARRSGDEALVRVGIADLAERRIGTLSYGQRRLVELARAVARGPRALLLDEPAAGLNPQETYELGRIVAALTSELDLVTVLVEHDLALVRRIAAWMVVLNFGELIAAGTPERVSADPAVIAAYIGASPA